MVSSTATSSSPGSIILTATLDCSDCVTTTTSLTYSFTPTLVYPSSEQIVSFRNHHK